MNNDEHHFNKMSEIERITRESNAFKLVSREFHREDTVIKVNGVTIGGKKIIMMAGPCSVENEFQVLETAWAVKKSGAHVLRGGAYKPRTSVYSFQGLGEDGLKILAKAKKETGLPIITEIMSQDKVQLVAEYADILQIGCRNMQNYDLLMEVGKTNKPVVLKRGFNSTLQEFLLSAEYIMSQGNSQIILCERGIRTFETMTRNTLDISAVPILKRLSHLPVMVDPSHATGKRYLILPMSRAAIAVGADVIMIEVHHQPDKALCDGAQSLPPEEFENVMKGIKPIVQCMGREI
ncbi:3-deoxy-7-phosphoheptulonate synthase [Pseudomonadota bacterium]